MSFDVFLQKFAAGEPAEVNRELVNAVLQNQEFTGPDDFGFYVVKFPDAVDVEFSAKGLDGAARFTACTFHIRDMSPHLARFILEIAKAGCEGNCCFCSGEESIGTRSSMTGSTTCPEPVLCESPD